MIAHGPGWELRLGDCIEGMRSLADNSVDVVITDPPYDEHTHKSGRRGSIGARDSSRGTKASFNRSRSLGFDAITQEDMAAAAAHFARVARRWTLVFCTVEMVGDSAVNNGRGWRAHLERAGLEYVRTAVWHKIGCTPQFTGDRPAQAVEAIVIAHPPGRKRWNGGGKHAYYAHPIVLNRGGANERLHTTQKPLSLMHELTGDFSEPGELIMDAYTGSGTTGVAALAAGRRFLGWERAKCAKCELTAEWHVTLRENGKDESAFLCPAHRLEVAPPPALRAERRDNYFHIACRRLRGDEAKPNPAQPSLFG